MITTTNLNELFQIVNVEHGEPHHVLGMHEVEHEGEKFVAVRAFVPQAKEIVVVDDADQDKTYPMMKIHEISCSRVQTKCLDTMIQTARLP